jgi:CRP-like cAMP-binding protein
VAVDKLGYLSRINIMEVLPPEALAEVAQVAPMNLFKKGSSIMEPGQRLDVLYLLKEGRVRICELLRPVEVGASWFSDRRHCP